MISVAMIGRDEAAVVGRALKSVRAVANEIVFVDTGSSDETPRIVESFGGVVIHTKWSEDFSAARNLGVESCKSDWILALDCDEQLVSTSDTEGFLANLPTSQEYAFEVEVINRLPDGSLARHSNIRLFRNTKEIRFKNPIHESVSESVYLLNKRKRVKKAGLNIDHDGYKSREINQKKIMRNLKILNKWVVNSPADPFAWYKLGLTLASIDRERSLTSLLRSTGLLLEHDSPTSFAFRFDALSATIQILEECGAHELASHLRGRAASHF